MRQGVDREQKRMIDWLIEVSTIPIDVEGSVVIGAERRESRRGVPRHVAADLKDA